MHLRQLLPQTSSAIVTRIPRYHLLIHQFMITRRVINTGSAILLPATASSLSAVDGVPDRYFRHGNRVRHLRFDYHGIGIGLGTHTADHAHTVPHFPPPTSLVRGLCRRFRLSRPLTIGYPDISVGLLLYPLL